MTKPDRAYTIGLYEKAMPGTLTWEEKLKAAGDAGYDYVEISIDETEEKLSRLDMPQEERIRLLVLMKETGTAIRSMCLSGHRRFPLGSRERQVREKGIKIMEKAIRLADDLGIRTIQLAGYDVYYEESDEGTRERFLHNLKKAVDMAAKAGVMMGFETMETDFMNTVGKAMAYVHAAPSAYLQVYPDIGNLANAFSNSKDRMREDLDSGRGHLMAIHLKETRPGEFREVAYGSGQVNFEAAIGEAWRLGIRRYVTELWYTGSGGWREEVLDANRRMTRILDRQR